MCVTHFCVYSEAYGPCIFCVDNSGGYYVYVKAFEKQNTIQSHSLVSPLELQWHLIMIYMMTGLQSSSNSFFFCQAFPFYRPSNLRSWVVSVKPLISAFRKANTGVIIIALQQMNLGGCSLLQKVLCQNSSTTWIMSIG